VTVLALLALAAWADDPDPADDGLVVTRNAQGVEEITVHGGDVVVEQARQAVIRDLREQGYTDIVDRGDYLLLRNVQSWKGEILLHDDGWIRMKRQPVRVQSRELPWAEQGSALSWASCAVYPPMCLRTGGVLVGRRKWLGVQVRTLAAAETDVQALGDRVADGATGDNINELPARLEALWFEGVPLEGAAILDTPSARKQAILAFWETRTNTIWGARVQIATEAFLRAVVQTDDDALTSEEIAAFNERRRCDRELDLDRPWEDVLAEVASSSAVP
jgi:hypothetical protein